MKRLWLYLAGLLGFGVLSSPALAQSTSSWTPLISSGSFTGITADVGSAASGIVGVCLIVCGVGILVHVLAGR